MCRSTVTCLLLSALPILAQQAAVDPYEDLPDYYPQHYRSLADVPDKYHDGKKLTGCFIHDSVRASWVDTTAVSGPDDPDDDIECHNPFYWDEHGRIKRFHYTGDPARKPPSGLPLGSEPREPQGTPCEGCLSEEQVLDVVRVYHRELGIEPLGYTASIVRGYPWNGHGNSTCKKYDPNYLDSLHPDPRDPHPNQRVNMRRVRRPMMGFNELCERFKDPQNRDLTWRVSFQIGWHEPENRLLNERNQHKRHWPRTPCAVTNVIHAQTGEHKGGRYYSFWDRFGPPSERCRGATIANVHLLDNLGRRAWNAYFQMHQRLFRYLPDSPSRDDRWLDSNEAKRLIELGERELEWKAKRKREAEEREREARGVRKIILPPIILPPNNLRGTGSAGAGVVPLSDTSDNGIQHILVYWGESPTANLDYDNCYQKDDPDTPDVDESEFHESKCKARVPQIKQCDASNVPLANPESVEEKNKHDCILWPRIRGDEQCWYTSNGRCNQGWCAHKSDDGASYRRRTE